MRMMLGALLIGILGTRYLPGAEVPAPQLWSSFRGPNGRGVSDAQPPIVLDRGKNLLWTTDLALGHSSPIVAGESVFLTGFASDAKEFRVVAISLKDGKVRWSRSIPTSTVEKVHEISSPATGTASTDGKHVYVYFGSAGLMAYDFEGKQLWKLPLPIPKMTFGSGTSPVVVGDVILLSRDEQGAGGYLLAVRASDGSEIWRQNYESQSSFGAYATPVVWNDVVLMHRNQELAAFRLNNGSPLWHVKISSEGTSVPVLGGGRIYVAAWSPFGQEDHLPALPAFDDLVKQHDANADGNINEAEFPSDVYLFKRPEIDVKGSAVSLKSIGAFRLIDRNKDGVIDKDEWDAAVDGFAKLRKASGHGLLSIEPGGTIAWSETRSVPEVSSPLYLNGRVYMVTNGGVITCVDGASGRVLFRGRLGAGGAYFASPVAANGHVYFSSGDGVVTVVKDDDHLEIASRLDLGEPIYATPALIGKRILIRTVKRLYAFGE